ncbi:hypothetical protein D3C73_1041850 [compost metagenome]
MGHSHCVPVRSICSFVSKLVGLYPHIICGAGPGQLQCFGIMLGLPDTRSRWPFNVHVFPDNGIINVIILAGAVPE